MPKLFGMICLSCVSTSPAHSSLCRLCGLKEATCRAHIIPKLFWKRIRKEAKHLLRINMATPKETKFTQSGIWERGILCPDCDNRLGVYDEYAYQVLPETPDPANYKNLDRGVRVYHLGKIDIDRFRRFLAALLLRAGLSQDVLFRRVKLGPYEDRLRDALNDGDAPTLAAITAFVVLYQPPTFNLIQWPPFNRRIDGVNMIQFYLFPWKLLIKLDKQPFRAPFDSICFTAQNPAVAAVEDDHSPGERAALRYVASRLRSVD